VPDLSDLIRLRGDRPTSGWRGAFYAVTRGLVNPGLSPAEAQRHRLVDRVKTRLGGDHSIACASVKGGVGKTTLSAGLGLTLAEHRGDRIVALDANPDAGTLADRLTGHCGVTVRELIDNLDTITTWTDISHYTSLAGRLNVLASEQDPAMSEAFSRREYEAVLGTLKKFFNIVITDSGTGLVHSAMGGVLDGAGTLVVAATPTVDAASRASKTLDWLDLHGYGELVAGAVIALSGDRCSREVDRAAITAHFAARCYTVIEIPYDPDLAIGAAMSLAAMRQRTRDAFLKLAAAVGDQFSWGPPARTAPTDELSRRAS
jgi:MinD-like ATPase involved in chromosome partitioning or flagellar assembly